RRQTIHLRRTPAASIASCGFGCLSIRTEEARHASEWLPKDALQNFLCCELSVVRRPAPPSAAADAWARCAAFRADRRDRRRAVPHRFTTRPSGAGAVVERPVARTARRGKECCGRGPGVARRAQRIEATSCRIVP